MKFFCSLFILLLAHSLELAAASIQLLEEINANNDHGFWLEENISKKFPSERMLKFRFEQRWAANYQILYYHEYEIYCYEDATHFLSKNLQSIFKNLAIGPGFNVTRLIQKNTLGVFHWVWLKKFILEAYLLSTPSNWLIKQRLRGEYIDYSKKHYKNNGVFRYRLEVYTPWKWTNWKINPFVWNEWFFRENTYSKDHPTGLVGGWHENRFRVGIVLEPFEHLSTLLFWQWLARKQTPDTHPSWFYNYHIGLIINLAF